MPFRDKPSDAPYKAMRWIDVWERLVPHIRRACTTLAFCLLAGGVALVVYKMTQMETWHTKAKRCAVQCHPEANHEIVADVCYCLPAGEPAYRPKGAE